MSGETRKRKRYVLRIKRIDKVSLVDRPDNPEAAILIHKRAPDDDVVNGLTRAERVELLGQIVKAIEEQEQESTPRMTPYEILAVHVADFQKRFPGETREQSEARTFKEYPDLMDRIEREDRAVVRKALGIA
jgi:hypothetical protein